MSVCLETIKPHLTPEFVGAFRALGKQVGYSKLGRAIAYVNLSPNGDGPNLESTLTVSRNGDEPQVHITHDLPPLSEIEAKIQAVQTHLSHKRIDGRKDIEAFAATLTAQRDLVQLAAPTTSNESIGHLEAVQGELEEIEYELLRRDGRRTRGLNRQAPQFGTQERVEWEANRTARNHQYDRGVNAYPNMTSAQLDARLAEFARFLENAGFGESE